MEFVLPASNAASIHHAVFLYFKEATKADSALRLHAQEKKAALHEKGDMELTKYEKHCQRLTDMGWLLPAFPMPPKKIIWKPDLKWVLPKEFAMALLSVQPMPSINFERLAVEMVHVFRERGCGVVCQAASMDGICCPHDSCDMEDGTRDMKDLIQRKYGNTNATQGTHPERLR